MINYVSLMIFTLALATGQALFKQAAITIKGRPAFDALWQLAHLPVLYFALAIYGCTTLLWIWILTRVSLMQAYPWAAGGVVIVPLIGWYIFGERVSPIFWLGAAFIIFGLLLTQYAVRPA